MRVRTHLLTGFSIGIAFSPNIITTMIAIIGAAFPDFLDKIFSFGNYQRWQKIHRTWSHNVFYWICCFIILYVSIYGTDFTQSFFPILKTTSFIRISIIFFCFGVLSHILLDMLTPMGIPWFPFGNNHRFSLKMIKVQSIFDIALGYIFLVVSICWFIYSGYSFSYWFLSPLSQ